MAEGDLIDGPWQMELRGVLMDADCGGDVDTGLVITEWPDTFGVPEGRTNLVPRPMRRGGFAGPQWMDGRPFVWSVLAKGATWDELLEQRKALASAFAPVEPTDDDHVIPLVFTLDDPAVAYRIHGFPTRARWGYRDAMKWRTGGRFDRGALCEFLQTDPIIYGNALKHADGTLGDSSGGHPYPHAYPHAYGVATSGSAVCENDGNETTYPVITITAGPSGASGIRLIQATTGEEWSITLSLNAGDTLTVDMEHATVLLNDEADRSPFVNRPPSVWFGLPPGISNVQLQATGTGTVHAVDWRDAHLL